MIIDSHTHLPAVSPQRTYERAKTLLLEDMCRDQVSYAILIPDNISGSAIGDLPTCLKLTVDTSELFMLGTIDLQTQGDVWIRDLGIMMGKRQIVGMKIFPGHDPIYPTDSRLEPVYTLCQAYDMPMVIHTGWNPGYPEAARFNDPKYIVQIAERYPDLKIVIAHFYWPEVYYCYQMTHRYPNIFYDTSGLADKEVTDATGLARIRGVLMDIIRYNPQKVIFGTDYAMCSREDHIEMIRQLPITQAARERIFWRNAAAIFNLSVGD